MSPPPVSSICHRSTHGELPTNQKSQGGAGGMGTAGIDSYITKIKNIKRHYDDHMAIKKQSFTKKSKSQLSKYRYLKNTGIYPYTATA